jgi:hydroxymethylpyrimidine pyrophosphatase-like HAD family hydrolase
MPITHAHPEVLAVANAVTRSNEHDGVALTLEAFAMRDYRTKGE